MEKDEFFIKRIRELANLSYQRDIVTFSDFLNLNEQNIINDRKNQMPGVVMECFGGYEQAERQMVAFHPDALLFPWKYPIKCLKAEPLAAKFSEDLTHRDFLGSSSQFGNRACCDRRYSCTETYCMDILSRKNCKLYHRKSDQSTPYDYETFYGG